MHMKKILIYSLIMGVSMSMIRCSSNSTEMKVRITNPLNIQVKDGPVVVSLADIEKQIPKSNPERLSVFNNDHQIASQLIDSNHDGKPDQLCWLMDMEPSGVKTLQIKEFDSRDQSEVFNKRTQAVLSIKEGGEWKWITKKNGKDQYEYQGGNYVNVDYLKVPEQHTDHSFYIRYEGPGWESDKVGYRFYLDWRNAVDIFGKLTDTMVLQNVGLDGFDSYHEHSPWGQDIFKVGDALGIGTFAYWDGTKAIRVDKTDSVDCRITENGILYSSIETHYFGWETATSKMDVTSDLSIFGGSRLTCEDLTIQGGSSLLCTGMIKEKGINPFTNVNDTSAEWVYLATYGIQTLTNDSLGLAVLVNRKNFINLTDDSLNQVVVLNPLDGKLTYYFLAAWDKEPGGIKNREQFQKYLNQCVAELSNPLRISFE